MKTFQTLLLFFFISLNSTAAVSVYRVDVTNQTLFLPITDETNHFYFLGIAEDTLEIQFGYGDIVEIVQNDVIVTFRILGAVEYEILGISMTMSGGMGDPSSGGGIGNGGGGGVSSSVCNDWIHTIVNGVYQERVCVGYEHQISG